MQGLRLDFAQPSRVASWAVVAWFGIALTIATQNHLYETALRLNFTWFDSFRYSAVECLFWCLVTPLLVWLVQHFDLFNAAWPRPALMFVLANAALEIVHALYRLPLHHFVYPTMAPIPMRPLLRYYLLGNLLNDVWVFWSIVGIGHLVLHHARNAERERALASAQMQALKSQLQPHFFFNALNSISSLMRDDVEAADDMITRLSDLLRVSLKTDAAQVIPLHQEIRVVETYIQIERMRFSDRLKFSRDLSAESLRAQVPALILLPLIENAVRHGIGPRSQPGEIRVSAWRRDGSLLLNVSNDGPAGRPPPVEGIGLASTRTRLRQHYGPAASFDYQVSLEGGMTIRLALPYEPDKDGAPHAD